MKLTLDLVVNVLAIHAKRVTIMKKDMELGMTIKKMLGIDL
jgi:histone H3/H4